MARPSGRALDQHVYGAWVALQDTDLGNGAMRTIVGSHRWGLLEDSANFGRTDLEGLQARLSAQEMSGAWIDEPCVLREGEVSFHHCLTLHGPATPAPAPT